MSKKVINHNLLQSEYWDKIANQSYKMEDIPYPAILEMEKFFDFIGLKEKSYESCLCLR